MQENKETTNITGKELVGTSFEQLAQEILNKKTVTAEELETVFRLDELFQVNEINVSAAETRQVRAYESNNYYAAMRIDLTGAHSYIKAKVAVLPEGERFKTYIELRKAFMALIERKYATVEDKLRDMIKKQQVQDGIANG